MPKSFGHVKIVLKTTKTLAKTVQLSPAAWVSPAVAPTPTSEPSKKARRPKRPEVDANNEERPASVD